MRKADIAATDATQDAAKAWHALGARAALEAIAARQKYARRR